MVIRALDHQSRRSRTARYVVPAQYSWDNGWELTGDLPVGVRTSQEEVVAVARLTFEEYGVGASVEDAVRYLLTSLTDYYQSLEAREGSLGPPPAKDLEILRGMVRPKSSG